jgi:hypothetical protein
MKLLLVEDIVIKENSMVLKVIGASKCHPLQPGVGLDVYIVGD